MLQDMILFFVLHFVNISYLHFILYLFFYFFVHLALSCDFTASKLKPPLTAKAAAMTHTLSAAVVAATRELSIHSLVVLSAAPVDGRSRSSDMRTV